MERTQLENDVGKLADALARDENTHDLYMSSYIIVNSALVLAGIRTAARLETLSRSFWEAFRKLLRLQRYKHLRIIKWRPGKAVEPIVADVTKPDVKANLDAIWDAYARRGAKYDLDPLVVEPMGKLLGYRCPYKMDGFASGGVFKLKAMIKEGRKLRGIEIVGFGCHKADASPRRIASITKALETQWVSRANQVLSGVKVFRYEISHFEIDYEASRQ